MARRKNKNKNKRRKGPSNAVLDLPRERLKSPGLEPDEIHKGKKYLHQNKTFIRTVLDIFVNDDGEDEVKWMDQRGVENGCKLATFAKTVVHELSPEMPTEREELEASAIVHVKPSDKTSRQIYLTPAMAAALLARNNCNRNLSKVRAEEYARDIRDGRWADNGQVIVLNPDGDLLDGQHRCHAVIIADIAIPVILVENVSDPRAFHTIDTGKPRSNADVLTIDGYKDTPSLAPVLAYIWRYENRSAELLPKNRVQPADTLDTVDRHPMAVDAAKFKNLSGLRDLRVTTQAGVAWYVIANSLGRKAADKFVETLDTGLGLRDGDPVAILRSRLTRLNKIKHAGSGMRDKVMAMTIMVANAVLRKKELRKLSWDETRVFPRFIDETMFRMVHVRPKEPRK